MTDDFAARRRTGLKYVQHATHGIGQVEGARASDTEVKVHWEDGISHGGGPHTWVKVSELTKLDALQYADILQAMGPDEDDA